MQTSFRKWLSPLLVGLFLFSSLPPLQAQTTQVQATPRKLALIVGIDKYPKLEAKSQLQGAVNDTVLMSELLIRKYGFKPEDVHILRDAQATRKNILESFEKYLIKEAKPGDIVVFHFSGHGGQVTDVDGDETNDQKDETIVPVDSPLIGDKTKDITDDTMNLLVRALKTENVTVTFDSCHSGSGLRGNGELSRALPNLGERGPAQDELAYNRGIAIRFLGNQLASSNKKGDAKDFGKDFKGVFFAAAQADQSAGDTHFGTSVYGNFTYHLTRALWQARPGTSFQEIASRIRNPILSQKDIYQIPSLETTNPELANQPFFFVPDAQLGASAVALESSKSGKQTKVWLGGLGVEGERGSKFNIIDQQGQKIGEAELTAKSVKQPLDGQIKILSGQVVPGSLLKEVSYIQRTEPVLTVAIAPTELVNQAKTLTKNRPWLRWIARGQEQSDLYLERNDGKFNLQWPGGSPIEVTDLDKAKDLKGALDKLIPKMRGLLARQALQKTIAHATVDEQNAYTITGLVYPPSTVQTGVDLAPNENKSKPLKEGDVRKPGEVVAWKVTSHFNERLFVNTMVINTDGEINMIDEVTLESKSSEFVGVSIVGNGIGEVLIVISAQSQKAILDETLANIRGRNKGKAAVTSPFVVAKMLFDSENTTPTLVRGNNGNGKSDFKTFSSQQVELTISPDYLRVEPQQFRVQD
jgi:Caspase domain